jgi:hypothetical protein
MILGYPWLNAMELDEEGAIAYCVGMKVEPEKCKSFAQYSPDRRQPSFTTQLTTS